ncbi:response regulator receiver sensor signal transduction histidine kinase [Phaffia rhodozyma]|uniref:Uncharacterized sensor-like histidine kinase ycf26 n=1 Tax=Phaffia rhodozyma TaxID=264483 RepID=A0A0F7STQ7_PHARH|nr:response regulator receiver sensor signal transduction histidine kinase [Phaffia rhodozyma]
MPSTVDIETIPLIQFLRANAFPSIILHPFTQLDQPLRLIWANPAAIISSLPSSDPSATSTHEPFVTEGQTNTVISLFDDNSVSLLESLLNRVFLGENTSNSTIADAANTFYDLVYFRPTPEHSSKAFRPQVTLLPSSSSDKTPGLVILQLYPQPVDTVVHGLPPVTELKRLDPALTQERPSNKSDSDNALAEADVRRSTFKMKQLIEEYPWETTSLGPKSEWPQSLLTALSIVLGTDTQSCLWWGPEFLMIYNDSHAEMSGERHPGLLGKGGDDAWGKELWTTLKPDAENVMYKGGTVHRTNDLLFLPRNSEDYLEETYFTWSWVPVVGDRGIIQGLLSRSVETTETVLAERRLKTLQDVVQSTSTTKSVAAFVKTAVDCLRKCPHDVPFLMAYSTTNNFKYRQDDRRYIKIDLVESIGVPPDHPSAPPSYSISFDYHKNPPLTRPSPSSPFSSYTSSNSANQSSSDQLLGSSGTTVVPDIEHGPVDSESIPNPGRLSHRDSISSTNSSRGSLITVTTMNGITPCPWPIDIALLSKEKVIVDDCSKLVEGFESRSWGELPKKAVVIAVADSEDPKTARHVVLIIGLNSRRPFEDDYRSWIQLLRLQLSTGLVGVTSYEAQIHRAEELSLLDKAKTAFFSNVSHELRTPLTLIAGPVHDLLHDPVQSEISKSLLSLVSRNVRRLSRLVDMLMDVSRLDAGRLEGEYVPKQLGIVSADLALLFRSAIEKSGIEYIVECDVTDTRPVYVDPEFWEKICFNLISNAFKYCLKGQIRVYLQYHTNSIEFGVEDTGVGIPQENIPHVVERFHRVASIGRSIEGTGIGLSLTSELVKLHGGVLDIISNTIDESPTGDHGSKFIVKIPLGNSHLPAGRVVEDGVVVTDSTRTGNSHAHGIIEEAALWSSENTSSINSTVKDSDTLHGQGSSSIPESDPSSSVPTASSSTFSRMDPSTLFWSKKDLILIVDDNQDMRSYLVSILSQYCRVIQAVDGQDAYNLACLHQPDLIISDIMMPHADGYDLIQLLKGTNSEVALIPVILITAKAGPEDVVNGLLMGAEDHLSKPFSSKVLIARSHLQMQMGKRRIELERKFAERTLELHVRMNEAEQSRNEAIEQKRQQELLVDVTSHEIRNPVSAILQNAGLCRENLNFLHGELQKAFNSREGLRPTSSLLCMLEEDIDALDAIYTMALSQERIANDVLSLARIQLSTFDIFPIQMDLMKEVKRIVSTFASECRLKRINLTIEFGQSLLGLQKLGFTKIFADPGRLSQVVVNLLSNAIRFTATSTRKEITVSIEVRKDAPQDDRCLPPTAEIRPVEFQSSLDKDIYIYGAVSDTGPGLTAQQLSQLFQRFKQASPQTHAVFGGSGLGLYVCRRICELMDGKIEVVSEPEQGSTFRFYVRAALVPMSAPTDRDLEILSVVSTSITTPPIESPAIVLSDPFAVKMSTVLIVEDNLINQKVLRRQLVKAQLMADVADNGQIGIDLIMAAAALGFQYSVILMDLEMPVMDGLTAIRKIREMEASGELAQRNTVYALTGNARQGQIEQALQMGMDEVIIKPYRIDDLLSKLRLLDI